MTLKEGECILHVKQRYGSLGFMVGPHPWMWMRPRRWCHSMIVASHEAKKTSSSSKYIWWAGEMSQWVKKSAPKPDELSSTPCTYTVGGENCPEWSSDPRVCQITHRIINANQFTRDSLKERLPNMDHKQTHEPVCVHMLRSACMTWRSEVNISTIVGCSETWFLTNRVLTDSDGLLAYGPQGPH